MDKKQINKDCFHIQVGFERNSAAEFANIYHAENATTMSSEQSWVISNIFSIANKNETDTYLQSLALKVSLIGTRPPFFRSQKTCSENQAQSPKHAQKCLTRLMIEA